MSGFLPYIQQLHGSSLGTTTAMPVIVDAPAATVARTAGVVTGPDDAEVRGDRGVRSVGTGVVWGDSGTHGGCGDGARGR
jgi:hypothetical protein